MMLLGIVEEKKGEHYKVGIKGEEMAKETEVEGDSRQISYKLWKAKIVVALSSYGDQ